MHSFGKQPRLLRNSGVAFVSNPLINGPCRPSRLSHYVEYKSARRSGPGLRFLDIEDPKTTQRKMFKEDMETGLTRKLTRREQAANKEENSGQNSPSKRRAKPTGRRTSERPCNKPRDEPRHNGKIQATKATVKAQTQDPSIASETESENSSTTSETSAPSPKRLNQKKRLPTTSTSVTTILTKRSVRHRQSTLANALGDPIPISTIDEAKSNLQPVRFNIDSPLDQPTSSAKPSLKSLIHEMGFSETNT